MATRCEEEPAAEAPAEDAGPERRVQEMGLLGKATKVAVAKKVYDEVRKPENQRRLRELATRIAERRRQPR